MLTSEPKWIALYTNPRAEKVAEKNLREEGYEVYLPLRRELHSWSDRNKWVDVPLLKSYIFAKVTARQEAKVREVQGIAFVIKFKNEVATIPEREIQMMKDFLAAEVDVQVRAIEQLRVGRTVRITGGGLEGKVGVLVSDCVDGNFAVEITGISMAMIIHVDRDLMEVVEDEKETVQKTKKKGYNI